MPWERLFHALAAQPGCGKNTAALFIKATIEIHRGQRFCFLSDGVAKASSIARQDKIFLPVDAVITHIFNCKFPGQRNDFSDINNRLREANYLPNDMLICDDLWLWGYFTQIVKKNSRTLAWNSDKFWCQPWSPKTSESALRALGEEFIELIK